MLEIYEIFWKTVRYIEFDEQGFLFLVLQPISVAHMNASMSSKRGNIFGLHPDDGPLVFAFVELRWSDPKKDARMEKIMKYMHDEFQVTLARKGGLHPWVYPNYAAGWQDPFRSLSNSTLLGLKDVRDAYDPECVFERLQPGAFRL